MRSLSIVFAVGLTLVACAVAPVPTPVGTRHVGTVQYAATGQGAFIPIQAWLVERDQAVTGIYRMGSAVSGEGRIDATVQGERYTADFIDTKGNVCRSEGTRTVGTWRGTFLCPSSQRSPAPITGTVELVQTP